MSITSDQIINAADELQSLGKTPTLAAVRERLGTRGSFSTIAPIMAKWRARQAESASAKVAIPEAFAARMRGQAEHVWADALGVAEEVVSSERDALRAARRDLETERAEMASLLDQSEGRLAEAQARLDELESRVTDLAEDVATAKVELAAAHARLDERDRSLTAERQERQSLQASLTEAREQVAQLARARPSTEQPPPASVQQVSG